MLVEAIDGGLVVYSLDIPLRANWDQHAQVPYTVDRAVSLAGQTIARIGYLLELDETYVWVTMDDFTGSSDFARLGVPTDWIWEQQVDNIMVRSNVSNVSEVTLATGGNLEFWHFDYEPRPTERNDADDSPLLNRPDSYGSLQIHHDGSTLLGYNAWSAGPRVSDLGIGTRPVGNPDWTIAANAGSYAGRRLRVFVLLE